MNHQLTFFDDDHEDDQRRKRLGFHDASPADLARLSEQKQMILNEIHLRWRSTRQLLQATGATEAMRRLRELRQSGYEIVKKGSGRSWEYTWTGRRTDVKQTKNNLSIPEI